MNTEQLNKELQKHLIEDASPSDILKGIKKNRSNGIPVPPPLPRNNLSGINQKTFNELVKTGLTEEEIKQKIGDLSIPWKDDTVEPIKTATEEQKLLLYDKLRVFNLPFDWELRLERLKSLDKNQASIDKIKEELKGWVDTFGTDKKPSDIKEQNAKNEQTLNARIKELEGQLTAAKNQNQTDLNDKDKKIKELEDKIKDWKNVFGDKEIGKIKNEYDNLSKRPDIPITAREYWYDYVLRWTKEHSDKIEQELKEAQSKAEQFWREKQILWRQIEKFLSDELKNKYIFAKPVISKDDAKNAIDALLIDVEHRWSEYLEKNTITPQNIVFGLILASDISKRPRAEQVLDWIRETRNKQMDYQTLFKNWSGSDNYNKENDFDGGSLCLLANNLEKYLEVKNFGTPKVVEVL